MKIIEFFIVFVRNFSFSFFLVELEKTKGQRMAINMIHVYVYMKKEVKLMMMCDAHRNFSRKLFFVVCSCLFVGMQKSKI